MLSSIPTFQVTAIHLDWVLNAMDSHPKTTLLVIPSTSCTHQASYPQDIPPKMAKKILSLKDVEMAELLRSTGGPRNWCLLVATSWAKQQEEAQSQVSYSLARLLHILGLSFMPHKFPHLWPISGQSWELTELSGIDGSYMMHATDGQQSTLNYWTEGSKTVTCIMKRLQEGISHCSICLSKLHQATECLQPGIF